MFHNETFQQQSLLAQYVRTGEEKILEKLKNIKPKGIKYYRNLIFNIVTDSIFTAYPIMTDFFGEEKMKEIVHNFFVNHKCQTFQVWKMPEEFKEYFLKNRNVLIQKHPFLPDLLLLEWKEIEFFMMPDNVLPEFSELGNLETDKLLLNPELQILSFQYPVHIKHPRNITPEDKGEFFVLIHRHPGTKDVFFTHLTSAAVLIVGALYEQPLSLNEMENLLPFRKEQMLSILEKALQSKIILGFQ